MQGDLHVRFGGRLWETYHRKVVRRPLPSLHLTEFIRNNYGTSGIKRQKLLMSLTDEESTTTFNQVIFTNDPEQERQCRLDVRFKIYNEQ